MAHSEFSVRIVRGRYSEQDTIETPISNSQLLAQIKLTRIRSPISIGRNVIVKLEYQRKKNQRMRLFVAWVIIPVQNCDRYSLKCGVRKFRVHSHILRVRFLAKQDNVNARINM